MDYKADLTKEINQTYCGRREVKGGSYGPTHIEVHPSVHIVLEFMERELPANHLIGVARALATLAPALWSGCPDPDVYPLMLVLDSAVQPRKPVTEIKEL